LAIITGTTGDDFLTGTAAGDEIQGLGGTDWIQGGGGDDVLDGGADSDHIEAGSGSDIVHGGGGNDSIDNAEDSSSSEAGNDQFFGDGGDDLIQVYLTTTRADTLLLDGGEGNDRITFSAWFAAQDVTIAGGDGNDVIEAVGGRSLAVDAGVGNDRIIFNFSDEAAGGYTFTLGAGADLLVVRTGGPRPDPQLGIHITDFAAGAGGDRVSFDNYLRELTAWNRVANPFTTGHLSLVQHGQDAVLRIDYDGGGDGFEDFIIFEDLSATLLTAFNIGFTPGGGASTALPQDGTAAADFLLGADGGDLLRGLGGDDEIHGGAGDDRVEGGLDRDRLDGGYGNDLVLGGDGNDEVTDSYGGNDQLFGGAGNDLLAVERSTLAAEATILLDGGADADELRYWADTDVAGFVDTVTFVGGDGNDHISTGGARAATIEAGSGDDTLYISNRGTAYSISLGAGTDRISLEGGHAVGGQIVVSDYETGAGGDRLDIDSYLRQALTGWNPLTNPYETGFLRLVQRSADAVLQMDRDGGGAASAFADLIVFSNVSAASFTTLNLGGYSSILGTEAGERLEGDSGKNGIYGFGGEDILVGLQGDDSLYGGSGGDRLEGDEGADTLDGGTGADTMIGGGNFDVYVVDDAGDQVIEGADYWTIEMGFSFGDEVQTGLAVYSIPANIERLRGTSAGGQFLTGSERSEAILAGAGSDEIHLLGGPNLGDGGAGDDRIFGGGEKDTIYGGAGADWIEGGGGDDFLYGFGGLAPPAGGGDHVEGGAGNDHIEGDAGDDVLLGGANNDDLSDARGGSDRLDGGEGDDMLHVARYPIHSGTIATLSGGIGNDSFSFVVANGSSVEIDGGEGNDSILVFTNNGNARLTLGTGQDMIEFSDYLPAIDPAGRINVTDFATGAAGDRLDLTDFFKAWLTNWDQIANPFATGHARLLQSGTSTLLQLDRDGGADAYATVLTFENNNAFGFTADNLGGYASGSFALSGSGSDDRLDGSWGVNHLYGLGGSDELNGLAGDDMLDGGQGADRMAGGMGNDIFYVDNVADLVSENAGEGSDRLLALTSYRLSAGAEVERMTTIDNLAATAINLTGNSLAQYIYGNAGSNQLDGGGGGDVMVGLGGDDFYYIRNAGDRVVEGSGEGNDRVLAAANFTLETGSEVEKFTTVDNLATTAINLTGNSLAQYVYGNEGLNVLDGGGGGDVLVGLGGDDFYYIRNIADRVVEAAGGGSDRIFAAANFTLEVGSEVEKFTTVDNLATTAINLVGNNLSQYIYGNAGANSLDGGGGGDVLVGLGGDDLYVIRNAADRAVETAGGGNDRILTAASFTLEAGSEVERLTTIDNLATTAINLTGNELSQHLYGNAGANMLDGKGSADVMTGFEGADIFAFTTALGVGNVDNIVDFVSGVDKIALDDVRFGLALGSLPAGAFVAGSAAQDADDRIIYNSVTGTLFYDADGNGAGAAVQFATLSGAPIITASDFVVI